MVHSYHYRHNMTNHVPITSYSGTRGPPSHKPVLVPSQLNQTLSQCTSSNTTPDNTIDLVLSYKKSYHGDDHFSPTPLDFTFTASGPSQHNYSYNSNISSQQNPDSNATLIPSMLQYHSNNGFIDTNSNLLVTSQVPSSSLSHLPHGIHSQLPNSPPLKREPLEQMSSVSLKREVLNLHDDVSQQNASPSSSSLYPTQLHQHPSPNVEDATNTNNITSIHNNNNNTIPNPTLTTFLSSSSTLNDGPTSTLTTTPPPDPNNPNSTNNTNQVVSVDHHAGYPSTPLNPVPQAVPPEISNTDLGDSSTSGGSNMPVTHTINRINQQNPLPSSAYYNTTLPATERINTPLPASTPLYQTPMYNNNNIPHNNNAFIKQENIYGLKTEMSDNGIMDNSNNDNGLIPLHPLLPAHNQYNAYPHGNGGGAPPVMQRTTRSRSGSRNTAPLPPSRVGGGGGGRRRGPPPPAHFDREDDDDDDEYLDFERSQQRERNRNAARKSRIKKKKELESQARDLNHYKAQYTTLYNQYLSVQNAYNSQKVQYDTLISFIQHYLRQEEGKNLESYKNLYEQLDTLNNSHNINDTIGNIKSSLLDALRLIPGENTTTTTTNGAQSVPSLLPSAVIPVDLYSHQFAPQFNQTMCNPTQQQQQQHHHNMIASQPHHIMSRTPSSQYLNNGNHIEQVIIDDDLPMSPDATTTVMLSHDESTSDIQPRYFTNEY